MIIVYYWPIMAMPSPRIRGLIFFQSPDGIAQARPYAARLHLISLFCENAISILINIDLWHNLLDDLLVFQCYAEKYLYYRCIGIVGEGAGMRPKSRMPGERNVSL